MTFEELFECIDSLPYSFPKGAPKLDAFRDREDLVTQQFQELRPIIPRKVLGLFQSFLAIKSAFGSPIAKALYQDLSVVDFISRLLKKRPLAFLDSNDQYLLRNGEKGFGAFELIGRAYERAPLKLENLLSYDEMPLSALIGVSTPTCFINSGARDNNAVPDATGDFEKTGIYIALVGARFERPGFMEHKHLVVCQKQNTVENGYGSAALKSEQQELLKMWAQFYGEEYFPTYEELEKHAEGRYLRLWDGRCLDKKLYSARIKLTLELFFREANERGRALNKRVYAHVVGLGLGLWELDPAQGQILVDGAGQILKEIDCSFISTVNFSWFGDVSHCLSTTHGEHLQKEGQSIEILFSKRDPAARLTGKHADHLLVAMYAWDGNAYPGNEFWLGSLSASGDAAAASCSLIAYSQNPDLNDRVSGDAVVIY